MIVFRSGAFGVGKTTLARALCPQMPGARLYDPERLGFVLSWLPGWRLLAGRGTADEQD